MKKIVYILILIIIEVGVISCGNNFLDVSSPNSLSDNTFWQSKKDAKMALTGCYNNWESWANIVMLDAASDNGYEQFNYGYQQKGNGEITPSNFQTSGPGGSATNNWYSYERIRKYNKFLAKIEDITMNKATKGRYKAEIRFLRAYDYFNKVMFFGNVPLVKKVLPSNAQLPRTPAKKVKKFILSELSAISDKLPVQNQIQSEGHITRGAALALKARLELYMEKYEDAMADSKAVIDMDVYELYPDYRGLFLPENESSNKEAILTIEYIPDKYSNWLPQRLLPAVDGGWSALSASKSLVNAYETSNGMPINEDPSYDPQHSFKNRDPRLSETIVYPGHKWNGSYYNPLDKQIPNGSGGMKANPDYHEKAAASRGGECIVKYVKPVPTTKLQNYGGDVMVIRLAEMYLTFAEAAVETGQKTSLALQYINKVRTRAGMPKASKLTEQLVRRERRVELAFEGLRYFDIKRWDLGPEVLNGPLYGSRTGSVNMQTGEVIWEKDRIKLEERNFHPERKYLFPIPQNNMDANPKLTQNPGY